MHKMIDYMVIDVETSPIDFKEYQQIDEDERINEFLNPIKSKIVAIGIRNKEKNQTFISFDDEKKILEDFWEEWSAIRKGSNSVAVVGFNICDFDMYMLVARSFINNVIISPYKLKDTFVDIREKISSYKWRPRGKLKDYADILKLDSNGDDGNKVAEWTEKKDLVSIKTYLEKDLEITDKLFQRAENLNITKIDRW